MRILFYIFLFSLAGVTLRAQVQPVHPTEFVKGTFLGISKPLRDIPPMTAEEYHRMELDAKKRDLNEGLEKRVYPYAKTALPKGPDPIRQMFRGSNGNRAPIVNFDGQTSPYYPPDCNGTVGPNHFMQTINCVYAIYNKSGALVAGPTDLNLIFGNVPGANRNDGDPIILYDEMADRYVVTEFSIPMSGANYVMIAVSVTNDPTGSYYGYSFQVSSLPDYPKFSVWRDGYYMGDNNTSGNDIYVFQREKMLIGQPAQAVGFNNPWRPASVDGFMCVPPIDNDGAAAPAGTPGMFIAFNDDAYGGGTDQLWLYELAVNWTTPASSTFQRTLQLNVQPFNGSFGNNWNNIDQKGTSQRVDGIPQVIMNVPQYRNFGDHQTIVCCHTVNTDGVRHAGIRWYELRKTTGNWEVRQQGTYVPDVHSRWMGSAAMNGNHEIAIGYSVSSTLMYPAIMFCGQSAGENANASGILDMTEDTIFLGTASQTGIERWGDYSQISVDPTDDKTFWYTNQYIGSGGSRKTRIASFRYSLPPVVNTLAASQLAPTSATLNGNVNPNGQETSYHFEYGLTPVALVNSTPVVSAGSGNVSMDVSADISGLTAGTSYYYRIVAESGGGQAQGLKVKFTTPLAPFLNVTPAHQNVGFSAGGTNFLVNSNVGWTVTSDALWCTVTPSGTGSDTIFVTVTENPVAATRTAQVSVTGTGLAAQVVTVTQDGAAPVLSVTPPNLVVPYTGGPNLFTIISNADWVATSDQTWCKVTPSGSLNGSITANCDTNKVITSRAANITVTVSGIPPVSVSLNQDGAPVILSVTPQNRNVAWQAGNTTFQVISNTNWTAQSDASWLTATNSGSGNNTIQADFQQNATDQQRIAHISVNANGTSGVVATVTQAKSGIGIGEKQSGTFRIIPNPNRGEFKIVLPEGTNPVFEIIIQDLTGKQVFCRNCKDEKDQVITLPNVAAGTYNVTIKSDSGSSVQKLVIF